MMEKYSTYHVYKNKETGEIVRKVFEEAEELEKYASSEKWEELDEDPEAKA